MVKKVVCFTLDEKIVEALDRIASKLGLSRAKLLEQLFHDSLDIELEKEE